MWQHISSFFQGAQPGINTTFPPFSPCNNPVKGRKGWQSSINILLSLLFSPSDDSTTFSNTLEPTCITSAGSTSRFYMCAWMQRHHVLKIPCSDHICHKPSFLLKHRDFSIFLIIDTPTPKSLTPLSCRCILCMRECFHPTTNKFLLRVSSCFLCLDRVWLA